MAVFEPRDDAAYLAWLAAYPDGYVINAAPSGRGYVLLHCATCSHIRTRAPFIGPAYIKVCSDSAAELDAWALRRRNAAAPLQGSGRRLLAVSFPGPSPRCIVCPVSPPPAWGPDTARGPTLRRGRYSVALSSLQTAAPTLPWPPPSPTARDVKR